MPPGRHAFAVAAAAAVALEAAPPPLGSAATLAASFLALVAGVLAPAVARGSAVRAAAVGSVVDAAGRAYGQWQLGGAASVSLAAAVAPALVGLAAFVLAVMTARWWRGIWRLGAEPRAMLSRLRAW